MNFTSLFSCCFPSKDVTNIQTSQKQPQEKPVINYQVNAFTKLESGGNIAGVCLMEGEWKEDSKLVEIASKNGFSETAFVRRKSSHSNEYEIRWFTPKKEIELCGHATLAAAKVLYEDENMFSVTFISKKQDMPIVVTTDGNNFTMKMPFISSHRVNLTEESRHQLTAGLNINEEDIIETQKGDKDFETDLMVILHNRDTLTKINPTFSHLARLNKDLKTRGIVLTCSGNGESRHDFYSRWLGYEELGILEDPVTGSAHCQLAPYWAKILSKDLLKAQQLSERQGELSCHVKWGESVYISGEAVIIQKTS